MRNLYLLILFIFLLSCTNSKTYESISLKIDLLNDIACRRNIVQDVLLRVSPGIDPHTHVYTTTGVLDSKFGFPLISFVSFCFESLFSLKDS